jgi:hemolysin III
MTQHTYPSINASYRMADKLVHAVGLCLILTAGTALIWRAGTLPEVKLVVAVVVYVLCALISNLASCFYHFSPWHTRRKLLRRIDHAAIYPSITGTFTTFFVQANTTWTMTLLWVCWGLTVLAVWNKITNETVQSRWSTASYLALGALGLCALPDMINVPIMTLWYILIGAACYFIGTVFYARRTMPYRYAIWHMWVNFGGIAMFSGIWIALF